MATVIKGEAIIGLAGAILLVAGLCACGAQSSVPPSTTVVSSPPAKTEMPSARPTPTETPDWRALLPPTPEPAPTPAKIWPVYPPPTPEPAQVLGGGTVQDGPFRFTLWVVKDPSFGHNPVAPSLYSDVEGRAIYMAWTYNGEESLAGPVSEYTGFPLPRKEYLPREYARIEPGWGGGLTTGIHCSPDFLPAQCSTDPIKVGLVLITPAGPYGACIRFRLTPDLEDVDPTSIAAGHLPCGDLGSAEASRQTDEAAVDQRYIPSPTATATLRSTVPPSPVPTTPALPSGWDLYVSTDFKVRLFYPAHWHYRATYGGETYGAEDGYFILNAAFSRDAPIEEVVNAFAYHKLRPFGTQPTIEELEIAGQPARLILPSPDQPEGEENRAALIVRYPEPVTIGGTPYYYFVLEADKEHIRQIAQTLQFEPLGPHLVTPAPVEPTASPPPPPTPGPRPTPRPVVLPSEAEAQKLTAGWKRFEDPHLGLRFRYPPEYEIRLQPLTAHTTGVSVDRPAQDPVRGAYREVFIEMLIFALRPGAPIPLTPQDLETWVQQLPPDENPIPGGGPIQVVEQIRVGNAPGFVIMAPLWPGDPPNVQSLIVVGKERVIWVALGDPNTLSPEGTEALWPLQMAFLATLEVTR